MSDQHRRGGGGRRRIQDEANLTHEEVIKKQKNREAAKKHREKKEKNLMALKKENEILEAKNKAFIERQIELKELIERAEKLIQRHKEAGCVLSAELRDWKHQTDTCNLLRGDPVVAMEESTSDDCPSPKPSPAMAEPSSSIQQGAASGPADYCPSGRDPMALFSGESLSPIPHSPTRLQDREKPFNVSNSPQLRQTTIRKGSPKNTQLLLAQLSQTCRRGTSHLLHNHSQSPAQGVQFTPTSSSLNQQNQVIALKTIPNGSSSDTPGPTHAIVQQSIEQAVKTRILQLNGNSYKVIYHDVHPHRAEKANSLSKQNAPTKENSPVPREAQGSLSTEAYQIQRGMDVTQTLNLGVNIPAAELLGNFEKTATNEFNTPTAETTDGSYSGIKENSWRLEGQPTHDFFIDATDPTFSQPENGALDAYSYTDDLNLTENPQHILHQIQTQNFQHESRDGTQSFGSAVQTDEHAFSSLGPKLVVAHPAYSLARSVNTVACTTTPCLSKDDEGYDEGRNANVKTPAACAPAILDMLSESNNIMLPSLQDEIKKSLSLPVTL